MTFEVYQFIICAVVFVLLTGLFTYLTVVFVNNSLKMTNAGLNDEKIKTEYEKTKDKKPSVIGKVLDKFVLVLFCVLLFAAFIMSMSVTACNRNEKVKPGIPLVNVVRSGSMSYISPNHKYLKEGQVTDQLQIFDIVFIKEPPKEEDLKVNDIVVYSFRGDFIIHRIVAIEEPNSSHPNQRYFLLQGDANDLSDRFPVTYDQIIGMYNGTRIPFIGSFVLFMQSPAGWLCILLVVFAMITTPIAEKKFKKARQARLLILYPPKETALTMDLPLGTSPEQQDPLALGKDNPFGRLRGNKDSKTFKEKLELSSNEVKERYALITAFLYRIVGLRIIHSKKAQTYKKGNVPIVKFTIKGKTLNAYIGLNPTEYENTKYIFTNASDSKTYANYPMRVKVSSNRQTKWVIELLNTLAVANNFVIAEKPAVIEPSEKAEIPFTFKKLKKGKTFKQKLRELDVARGRYKTITRQFANADGVRFIEAKKSVTYKKGNTPIVKFTIKGKTLNAYIGLNPTEYENTKYIFTNVSDSKKYANYPMRVKVTSNRQVKWVIELIQQVLAKRGEL